MFKNPETIRPNDPSHVDKNWSHDGKWEGGGLGGWAGGALDAWSKVSSVHITKNFGVTNIQTHDQSVANHSSMERLSTAENKESDSFLNDGWGIDDANHETVEDQVPVRKRSARFGQRTESVERNKGSNRPNGSPGPYSHLFYAIENKTCQELINLLESGISHDAKVVEMGLQECYNKVKEMISLMNKDPESEAESKAMSDLNAKRKVLNIYINSTLLVEKALNLEHWGSFELRVVNADVRFLDDTNKTAAESLMVSGKIKLGSVQTSGGKMEILVSLL